eukprot:SAG11_NODE_366_length_10128_cov_4.162030_9_plen_107_part_00
MPEDALLITCPPPHHPYCLVWSPCARVFEKSAVLPSDEYGKFLKKINPSNCLDEQWDADVRRFNCGTEECPIFDDLFSVRALCETYPLLSLTGVWRRAVLPNVHRC